ncbi:U5 snRNP GTPase SNU114 [Lachancea thermotolerans CBS 6340]|uniref:KLTH0F04598p n=1 Tax=Lachancea thermotolerans (strain ATCC 56472 / CBS 6340 / NRRL Y-8284) TaxID=559295 RepID=C5DKH0_LACTC|nr:KLTH0F04598p [Lachancea thermotolerans CBS 6340]CAR23971.1 KLTH0F04598p [Lachancea thermotolerans CBS 6340]
MDEELYDEFGNLIGGEAEDSDTQDESLVQEEESSALQIAEANPSTEIVHRETLATAFPDDVEILVETEDHQATTTPLVEPAEINVKKQALYTESIKHLPRVNYDRDYFSTLHEIPERTMNVTILGPLHSGKTSLVDLLILQAHKKLPGTSKNVREGWKPLKYMDNTKLEIERGISYKLNGFSFLATDLQQKSVALTVLDCPGHVNFIDEVAVSLAASDTCVIVVDVVEGVTSIVQQLIKQCEKHGLPIVFVLNKVDRLILELKLPPQDAYLKLANIVNQINSFSNGSYSPEQGNVLFSSAKLGFTFSIEEFVLYYYSKQLGMDKLEGFLKRMWGNIYFQDGRFSKVTNQSGLTTFSEFILIPLYKIFTHSLSNDPENLAVILKREFRVTLPREYFKIDPQPLLRKVLGLIFRDQAGFVGSVTSFGSFACEAAPLKKKFFDVAANENDTLAHVLKLMDYCGDVWALVRVYQGVLNKHAMIKVLDGGLPPEDDAPEVEIQDIALMGGRYVFPVEKAHEGQIVLVKGIDQYITKSGTLASSTSTIFPPIDYINDPVFKVVLQVLHPQELPLMLEGLKKVNKFYPGMFTCVEESGENVILGTGELYLDCLLYDLRTNYARIEIQVSSPLVKFSETCVGESFASIPVSGASGHLELSIAAQPLERELAEDLASGALAESEIQNKRQLSKKLREKYSWDSLAARNVWSLRSSNVLVDDTLPDETDKERLAEAKHSICQGFEWATREGPLAEEPIRGVHFRLLSVSMGDDVRAGQLIPLVRKACYVAMLTATPALLEPIYEACVLVHDDAADVVEELFSKRRGARVYNRVKIPATPLIELRGQIPVIDSIGFETDLRLATNGTGMCQLQFWNKIWRKVPGDVMDEDAVIPKLKPAPRDSMSRDFVMKTRRRKGLSSEGYATQDGPSLARYIEPELFQKLKDNNLV